MTIKESIIENFYRYFPYFRKYFHKHLLVNSACNYKNSKKRFISNWGGGEGFMEIILAHNYFFSP